MVDRVFLVRGSVEDQAALPVVAQAPGTAQALLVRADGICPVVLERELIQADRTVGPTPQRESAAHVPRELAQVQWLLKRV